MKKLVIVEDSKNSYYISFLCANSLKDYEIEGNTDIYAHYTISKDIITENNTLEDEIALFEDGLKADDIEIVKYIK